MAITYRSPRLDGYRMSYHDPYRELEPQEHERAEVAGALEALAAAGVLPQAGYEEAKLLAHRRAVRELFEVPWTAITPRMERLLYGINAIVRPRRMVAAGVFCGFTFISNAGAAVGPGACYEAAELLGVEIVRPEAERAERNVRRLDPTGVARVLAADAIEVVQDLAGPLDLLYLDADGQGGQGKGIYLDILEAALPRLRPGALVLAHNSENGGEPVEPYLEFVRQGGLFRASVNVIVDIEGLEVSVL